MGAAPSDREAALRAGDDGLSVPLQPASRSATEAIERIYADHHRDVYRYVLGLTRSTEDAEEITADTFERALRNWQSIPPRPVPWLLLTARRIATDRWRRARRLTRILRASHPGEHEPSTGSETEFWGWFDAVAAALTDRQREVLILRYQRDLTDADIGTVMGLSESGVRSLAARALAVLREHPELLA